MLRRSGLCCRHWGVKHQKYPDLISYHALPWLVIAAGSVDLHLTLGPHYAQLLDLASRCEVPGLVVGQHPTVPTEEWPFLLPGMVYILPVDATTEIPQWAPLGWEGERVTADHHKTAYYAQCHRDCAKLAALVEFTSPDLRLCCNAVGFKTPHVPLASQSSLASMGGSAFTIFQFFRPNRAPSELVRPLEKYYVHKPAIDMLMKFSEHWQPTLSAPKQREKGKHTAGPMRFKPPVCYQYSLPEVMAIKPGDAFGSRDLMWGYHM